MIGIQQDAHAFCTTQLRNNCCIIETNTTKEKRVCEQKMNLNTIACHMTNTESDIRHFLWHHIHANYMRVRRALRREIRWSSDSGLRRKMSLPFRPPRTAARRSPTGRASLWSECSPGYSGFQYFQSRYMLVLVQWIFVFLRLRESTILAEGARSSFN